MNKKIIIGISVILISVILIVFMVKNKNNDKEEELETSEITATVLSVSQDAITVQDKDDIIYTFSNFDDEDIIAGENLTISYTGYLDKDTEFQNASIVKCAKLTETDLNKMLEDKSEFSAFYKQAEKKLKTMTLKEKIGQVLLVGAPEKNQQELLKENPYSGYILYKRDFENKTPKEVRKNINNLQKVSDIPLLIAVDEEGGSVVRVGSNPSLVGNNTFKSPQELYKEGGMDAIKNDTKNKSKILNDLGINLNLAPVVDVATDPNSYIYNRTIGQNTEITSEYAKTVINASKGLGVSYTLKHFPGYGDNTDTHSASSADDRSYDDILKNDIPPFTAGTKAGAEAVLVSHNIIKSIDPNEPASLSASVHNLLRNTVGFSGISITDDLSMSAINDENALVKALLAGNDLLIVTDSTGNINKIKAAIENGSLDEKVVDKAALRVIAWKYYKGLLNTK